MKTVGIDALRNVALIGHGGSGKTSLTEAMLYAGGVIDRLGKVEDGTTTTDFDPDETKRKISINSALARVFWKDHKINLIDTPGYSDFVGEVKGSLRVADCALILIHAVSGVEVGTEQGWRYAGEAKVPRILFINKMDRENADFFRTVTQIGEVLGHSAVPIQIPIGSQDTFSGIVDLLKMKAYTWSGKDIMESEIPADLVDTAQEYHDRLIEAAAEGDEDLTTKYLEGESLTDEEVVKGVREGIANGTLAPILCGSATKLIGISCPLDLIADEEPSPKDKGPAKGKDLKGEEITRDPDDSQPLSAIVFKTMADPYVGKLTYFKVLSGVFKSDSHLLNSNRGIEERIGQLYFLQGKSQEATSEVHAGDIGAVAKLQGTVTGETLCDKAKPIIYEPIEFPKPVFTVAIKAKSKVDEDKMGPALNRVAEEDPTFAFRRDMETGQTLISGMGEAHMDIVVERLKRKFGADVTIEHIRVPYRETFSGLAKVQGRHKKQTGGRGQFGDCWVEFTPLERGEGFKFVDSIVGGAIPRQYIPAVEKGIQEAMVRGVLAGYPVVDIQASCYDGSFHPVDSSEMAFKMAGILAFQAGAQKAGVKLLEPINTAEIEVPERYMGDVISDLNGKRGRVLGMQPQDGYQLIRAQVPYAEMLRYATDLRSITRGRGSFRTEFSHYEEVPGNISQEIIAQSKKEKEE